MKYFKNEEGFVLLPVLAAFFIILFAILPFIESQLIWKENVNKMISETETDYILESGVAFALDELKKNPDFRGNKSYVYNGSTYVLQFNQVSVTLAHCIIRIPTKTYKKIDVDISKDDYSIVNWEEGFQYD